MLPVSCRYPLFYSYALDFLHGSITNDSNYVQLSAEPESSDWNDPPQLPRTLPGSIRNGWRAAKANASNQHLTLQSVPRTHWLSTWAPALKWGVALLEIRDLSLSIISRCVCVCVSRVAQLHPIAPRAVMLSFRYRRCVLPPMCSFQMPDIRLRGPSNKLLVLCAPYVLERLWGVTA